MTKKLVSPARLKQAIIRSVASSTAIETRRSIGAIEKKLLGSTPKSSKVKLTG